MRIKIIDLSREILPSSFSPVTLQIPPSKSAPLRLFPLISRTKGEGATGENEKTRRKEMKQKNSDGRTKRNRQSLARRMALEYTEEEVLPSVS